MSDFEIFQKMGNNTSNFTAIGQDLIGNFAHYANSAAAKHQANSARCHGLTKCLRSFGISAICA